jgi:hypothetical protein
MARANRPTFEESRMASKNGTVRLGATVQGRPFTYAARTCRERSLIDFDLYSGNHDLRPEVQQQLWERYEDYCTAFRFRSRLHSHFSKTSIMCEVKREHAEEWFSLLWQVVSDVDNLSRIRCEYLADYARKECGRIIARGVYYPVRTVDHGELVRAIAPAFGKIIELL